MTEWLQPEITLGSAFNWILVKVLQIWDFFKYQTIGHILTCVNCNIPYRLNFKKFVILPKNHIKISFVNSEWVRHKIQTRVSLGHAHKTYGCVTLKRIVRPKFFYQLFIGIVNRIVVPSLMKTGLTLITFTFSFSKMARIFHNIGYHWLCWMWHLQRKLGEKKCLFHHLRLLIYKLK